MLVEVDSKVVVNMIKSRSTQQAHLQPLLTEALALLDDAHWTCSVSHIFREANFCADGLAALGHSGVTPLFKLDCL